MIAADMGIPTKRLLGQARDGGHDIDLGSIKVEVKRRKRVAGLYEWIDSADVVALRGDGKEWLVVMRWPMFAKLAREEVKDVG